MERDWNADMSVVQLVKKLPLSSYEREMLNTAEHYLNVYKAAEVRIAVLETALQEALEDIAHGGDGFQIITEALSKGNG